jgi:hypothetical protein
VYAHWDENNLAQERYFPAEENYERKIIILHRASSTIKQSESQEFQQQKTHRLIEHRAALSIYRTTQ